jgi:hypothetical protein
MGVSIYFPNFTLDCGYFGFKLLRDNILKMVPHKKLQDIYEDVQDHLFMFDAAEKKKYFDDINKKINDMNYLANEGSSKSEKRYLNQFCCFFWACDCEAKMRSSVAKAIWHYIKDAKEDFRFGYDAITDCATFQRFKQGVKDCVDTNKGFRWM